MLEHLEAWEHFGKDVCSHVISQTVQQLNFSALDDITDEMIPYVNVLCVSMVVVTRGLRVSCR